MIFWAEKMPDFIILQEIGLVDTTQQHPDIIIQTLWFILENSKFLILFPLSVFLSKE